MEYDEYVKAREEILKNLQEKTAFTKEMFEGIIAREKIEKTFEEKIDKLAKEYVNAVLKISTENIKSNNYSSIGYYAILEYCLKQIKLADKNYLQGFVADLSCKYVKEVKEN